MFAIELMQAASKYSNTIKLVSGCTSSNPPECIGDGYYVSSFSSAIAGGTTVVSFMAGQGYEVTLSQPLEDMIPAGTMIYFSPAPFSGDGTWMFGVPSDAGSQQAWPPCSSSLWFLLSYPLCALLQTRQCRHSRSPSRTRTTRMTCSTSSTPTARAP